MTTRKLHPGARALRSDRHWVPASVNQLKKGQVICYELESGRSSSCGMLLEVSFCKEILDQGVPVFYSTLIGPSVETGALMPQFSG